MRAIIGYAALVGLLAIASFACEERPARPSPPSVSGTPTSLEIRGTTRLYQPGDTGQLMPVAVFASGMKADATTLAANFSIPGGSAVAVMAANGYWKATGYGRATVQLTYDRQSASTQITVLPEGMFLLSGRVTQGTLQLPVPQAKVQVAMPGASYTTATDSLGRYSLPAIGPGTLSVDATGFPSQSLPVTVNGDLQLDFAMGVDEGFPGVYQLTFMASSSCSFPANIATRQYIATVQVKGTDVVVLLSGANLMSGSWYGEPGFIGTTDGSQVRFQISSFFSAYSFTEDLGNGQLLSFDGAASGTIGAATVTTTFNGTVGLSSSSSYTACTATDHRLIFRR